MILPRRQAAFTVIEVLIAVLILGVLVAFAVPSYTRSVESQKADQAAQVVMMVAAANRSYRQDNGRLVDPGTIDSRCRTSPCGLPGRHGPCNLVSCGYLPPQRLSAPGYQVRALNGGTADGCGFSPLSGNYLACAGRCQGASPCTSHAEYSLWGYAVRTDGTLEKTGTAPSR